MNFETNPADERYELDLCIQEINNLKAERDALQSQLTAMQSVSVDEVAKCKYLLRFWVREYSRIDPQEVILRGDEPRVDDVRKILEIVSGEVGK